MAMTTLVNFLMTFLVQMGPKRGKLLNGFPKTTKSCQMLYYLLKILLFNTLKGFYRHTYRMDDAVLNLFFLWCKVDEWFWNIFHGTNISAMLHNFNHVHVTTSTLRKNLKINLNINEFVRVCKQGEAKNLNPPLSRIFNGGFLQPPAAGQQT